MQEKFDPYFKWLGIPPKEQPPNHYRLLGIKLYETDRSIIADAANKRVLRVQTFMGGKYTDISKTILAEIGTAADCLLDPDRKLDYDVSVQKVLASLPPPLPGGYKLAEDESRMRPLPKKAAVPSGGPVYEHGSEGGLREVYALFLESLHRNKTFLKFLLKILAGAVTVIVMIFVFLHGGELWNYTFDKSSSIVGKITGSTEEKPPEHTLRVRTAPGRNRPNEPRQTSTPTEGEQPAGTTANAGTMNAPPPPPDSMQPQTTPDSATVAEAPKPAIAAQDASLEKSAPEVISMDLPDGKSFKSRNFKVNVAPIIEALKESPKDDQLLMLEDPTGRICAFTEQKKGILDGIFVAFNERQLPTLYATYADGALDGLLKTWGENGQRIFWSQYEKGVRNGFACLFVHNAPRLLLEVDHGKIKGIHLCSDAEVKKSFSSLEEASADKDAVKLLETLETMETDIKGNEELFKNTAKEAGLRIVRERKALNSPQKRQAAQTYFNQLASEKQSLIKSFWQYKGW